MFGLICVVAAGVMWGTLSIYVNALQSLGFTSVQCSLIRYAFSFLILFLFLAIKDRKALKIKAKDVPLFLATGVLGLAGFSITYFLAMEEIGGASVPSLILNTAPIFVIAVSPVVFKEKITAIQLCSIGICILGITFVTGVLGGGKVSFLGIAYGIISALCYAEYIIVSKIALKKYSEYTVSTYAMLCAFLCLLPVCVIEGNVPTAFGWKGALGSAGLVLVGTLFPFLLYSKGLKRISAAHASVFGTVDPATACIVGLLFFKESFSVLKILGVLLVLGAIAMQALNDKEKKGERKDEIT